MTDKEIERVSRQVDAIANPLTILALMWLFTNQDPARTDGSQRRGGRVFSW